MLAPARWSAVSTSAPSPVEGWVSQFLAVSANVNRHRLEADLTDVWESLPGLGIREIFTWTEASESRVGLLIVTVSVLPAPLRASPHALDELLRSVREGEEKHPLDVRKGPGGVLRAERLIEERRRRPWASSREVRFAIPHPGLNVAALIIATSPSIYDDSLFHSVDLMAATFQWVK